MVIPAKAGIHAPMVIPAEAGIRFFKRTGFRVKPGMTK
jgi:hypothetical protein